MYKLFLSLRYLRTRYIALASIISVTLGVATMIVVNGVMAGFSREMEGRLHGILSDVVFESSSLGGFSNPDWHMEQINQVAGEYIETMTPTVHVPALLNFRYGSDEITQPVQLIGIPEDAESFASEITRYLQHPDNRERLSFELRDGGYDTQDHQLGDDSTERPQMRDAGWMHRRIQAARQKARDRWQSRQVPATDATARGAVVPGGPLPAGPARQPQAFSQGPDAAIENPFHSEAAPAEDVFDPAVETHDGAILGIALVSFRHPDGREHFLALPGDDVNLTFPSSGTPPKGIHTRVTVVDFYESKMSEYDSSLVFVPLHMLQKERQMIDPQTGIGYVSAIQIKLKDPSQLNVVRDKLRQSFRPEMYRIETWRDKQGPLLAAVQVEKAILNVLLFLIIAVAGFGILAIFFMIVVEKTRDIGVLKSLGASSSGVMGIFLTYGLSLGVVGSGVGMILGLLFLRYINEFADLLAMATGQEIFDPTIYYFYQIPTYLDPLTVVWIVLGAVAIALLASILPARRAARLHPVEALRYE